MSSLHELQQGFAHAMWADLDSFLPEIADQDRRRLEIYRNTVLGTLADALAAIYPVVQKLVGERFFRAMAKEYANQCPSSSGDLHEYGADFAEFIAQFPPAGGLPYLPDTARLEWCWHCAFHAEDATALPLTELAKVPPERWENLRFQLNPSAALLYSCYPVQQIWAVNQSDYQGEAQVDLAQGEVYLLILRQAEAVIVQALSVGSYSLLQALQAQQPVAAACEAALAVEPELDLNTCLQQHVQQLTLTGFSL